MTPTRLRRRAPGVLVAGALASLTTGCLTVGKAGVLGFDYEARDRLFFREGPSTAIAVGGHVDINVYSKPPRPLLPLSGGELPRAREERDRSRFTEIEVRHALSSIPGVARVDAPAGSRVRVHGETAGQATLTFETERGVDTVEVRVAPAEAASVRHWVMEVLSKELFATGTAFVRGGTGRFLVEMLGPSGERVVGAGVTPPIAVEPAGAAWVAPIADGDLAHGEVRFDAAGLVELRTLRRDPLRVTVVDGGSVKGLELAFVDGRVQGLEAPSTVREGTNRGAIVRGVLDDGRRVVLLGDVARVESATPEVCTTPADETEVGRWTFGDGVTAVEAVKEGACRLVATLGALRAEVAVTVEPKAAEATVTREPEAAESEVR